MRKQLVAGQGTLELEGQRVESLREDHQRMVRSLGSSQCQPKHPSQLSMRGFSHGVHLLLEKAFLATTTDLLVHRVCGLVHMVCLT